MHINKENQIKKNVKRTLISLHSSIYLLNIYSKRNPEKKRKVNFTQTIKKLQFKNKLK